jgi:hypothetical protein
MITFKFSQYATAWLLFHTMDDSLASQMPQVHHPSLLYLAFSHISVNQGHSSHSRFLFFQVLCCLRHTSKSILLWLFWRWDLANCSPRLASNHDPLDLSLLDS